jgi:SnoaL-like domain
MTALTDAGHAAIARVVIRYATSIDRRDWPGLCSCFTEDCMLDYGDLGSWQGAEAFTAYSEEIHRPYGATMHRISNIESDGDGPGAHARSYVDALLYTRAGELAAQARGIYDDRLTSAGGEWRISARRFTTIERRVAPQP